jgi:AcrR family transcriptional regulator
MPRKYELKKRAEAQDETRRRITEAAVELHGTVGPAQTTISAIAERAGVQRLTVYRHFPDERSLFAACTGHWRAQHPPPDPARWTQIEDPRERAEVALRELYAWYAANERMLANAERDRPTVPALAELTDPRPLHEAIVAILMAGRPRRKVVRAFLAHAVAFPTWRSLCRVNGLSEREAARLMARLAAAAE